MSTYKTHNVANSDEKLFPLKECAISIALAVGLVTGMPFVDWSPNAYAANPAMTDLSVLISGPPIKDPAALLRYALPIDNKAIREVQKPLEDITDSLKVAGVKALDSVERVRNHKFPAPLLFNFFPPSPLFWIYDGSHKFSF
ncbi:hypothetical protein OIU76_028383 [Salix suchowensis]|nr:hypothetical protein OIU76_028383 [Salix suchowensis]